MFSSIDPIETGANSSPALADYMLLSSELSRCPSTIVAFLSTFSSSLRIVDGHHTLAIVFHVVAYRGILVEHRFASCILRISFFL